VSAPGVTSPEESDITASYSFRRFSGRWDVLPGLSRGWIVLVEIFINRTIYEIESIDP
jgi:hypothetical protein